VSEQAAQAPSEPPAGEIVQTVKFKVEGAPHRHDGILYPVGAEIDIQPEVAELLTP
jgi:hypothetical protein